jgi:hypothetical protein
VVVLIVCVGKTSLALTPLHFTTMQITKCKGLLP